MNPTISRRLAGLLGIALVAGFVAVTLGMYQKVFSDVVTVTVTSERAGLLLDPGAKVRVYGLSVGEVRSVEPTADGTVTITLAVDRKHADRLPANLEVAIDSTTVFGAKYIDLRPSSDGSGDRTLADGTQLEASSVAPEVNDVFLQLNEVLTTIDPAALNQTLTTMASAFEGRGDQMGQYLVDLNDYLTVLNGHSDELARDIQLSGDVLRTYADVSPDLLTSASNFTTTSQTLTSQSTQLGEALDAFSVAAGTGTDLFRTVQRPLIDGLHDLRRVTDLGAEYSPMLTCTVEGLANHREIVTRVFGVNPGIQGEVSLMPSQSGYTFPDHLPKLATGHGPNCFSNPDVGSVPFPGRHYFDDGSDGVYSDGGTVGIGDDPVSVYFDLVEGFFGTSGLNLLLGGGA